MDQAMSGSSRATVPSRMSPNRVAEMRLLTAKQQTMQAIEQLPDDVTLGEIVYRLHVIDRVHKGLADVDTGSTLSSEEMDRKAEAW